MWQSQTLWEDSQQGCGVELDCEAMILGPCVVLQALSVIRGPDGP